MRAVIQRVREGRVSIAGRVHGEIGIGFVILLAVRKGDGRVQAEELAGRCANLRVFDDHDGRMNRSLLDVGGDALVVSQFTLYADTSRGNRPGFSEASAPEEAETIYNHFIDHLRSLLGENRVSTGAFRTAMEVTIVNDGPVTILLETKPLY